MGDRIWYSPALADVAAEHDRLDKILARSIDPQLAFGNDADDMRAPGYGIDPRINVGDMSNDGITYEIARTEIPSTTAINQCGRNTMSRGIHIKNCSTRITC